MDSPTPSNSNAARLVAHLQERYPDKHLPPGAHHHIAQELGVPLHVAQEASRYGWYIVGPVLNRKVRRKMMANPKTEPKTLPELIALAESQGWTVENRGSSHIAFKSPDITQPQVTTSRTLFSRNGREWQNTRAALRRAGMLFGNGVVKKPECVDGLPDFPPAGEDVAETTPDGQEPEAEVIAVALPSGRIAALEDDVRILKDAVALLTGQQDVLTQSFMAYRKATNDGLESLLAEVAGTASRFDEAFKGIADNTERARRVGVVLADFQEQCERQFDRTFEQLRKLDAAVSKADPLASFREMLK